MDPSADVSLLKRPGELDDALLPKRRKGFDLDESENEDEIQEQFRQMCRKRLGWSKKMVEDVIAAGFWREESLINLHKQGKDLYSTVLEIESFLKTSWPVGWRTEFVAGVKELGSKPRKSGAYMTYGPDGKQGAYGISDEETFYNALIKAVEGSTKYREVAKLFKPREEKAYSVTFSKEGDLYVADVTCKICQQHMKLLPQASMNYKIQWNNLFRHMKRHIPDEKPLDTDTSKLLKNGESSPLDETK